MAAGIWVYNHDLTTAAELVKAFYLDLVIYFAGVRFSEEGLGDLPPRFVLEDRRLVVREAPAELACGCVGESPGK